LAFYFNILIIIHLFKTSVGLRPASNFVGILEYVKNMPSVTNSQYKGNELPKGNRFTATKIQLRTVQLFLGMWSRNCPSFGGGEWSVYYDVSISPPLTLALAK